MHYSKIIAAILITRVLFSYNPTLSMDTITEYVDDHVHAKIVAIREVLPKNVASFVKIAQVRLQKNIRKNLELLALLQYRYIGLQNSVDEINCEDQNASEKLQTMQKQYNEIHQAD